MTDVFISYKRRLRPRVEAIALALAGLDLDVWFDAALEPGGSFSAEISREVRSAKCVLVCFSNDAFPHGGDENGWVIGEATIGRNRRALVATLLEPTDLDPPWNTVHVEDLIDFWPNDQRADRTHWQKVLSAIGRHVGRPGLADYDQAQSEDRPEALWRWAQNYPSDPLAARVLRSTRAITSPWAGDGFSTGDSVDSASVDPVPLAPFDLAPNRHPTAAEEPRSTSADDASDDLFSDAPSRSIQSAPWIPAERLVQVGIGSEAASELEGQLDPGVDTNQRPRAPVVRAAAVIVALLLIGSTLALWRYSPVAHRNGMEVPEQTAVAAALSASRPSSKAEPASTEIGVVPTTAQGARTSSSLSPAAVQLSSQPTEADAMAAKAALTARYGAIFQDAELQIQKVDLGQKGSKWRVRLPTSSLTEAQRICDEIKTQGGDCFPTAIFASATSEVAPTASQATLDGQSGPTPVGTDPSLVGSASQIGTKNGTSPSDAPVYIQLYNGETLAEADTQALNLAMRFSDQLAGHLLQISQVEEDPAGTRFVVRADVNNLDEGQRICAAIVEATGQCFAATD